MARGVHHLVLVTDDMRMTVDFYVRVLGMPLVHGLRTASRPPNASPRVCCCRASSTRPRSVISPTCNTRTGSLCSPSLSTGISLSTKLT
jgi:hypothetical protein